MAEVTKAAVDSLVGKIESLDLTEDELAVLDAVLAAAEEGAEVSGFEFKPAIKGFALPDMRGRIITITGREAGNPKGVVINHEEQ